MPIPAVFAALRTLLSDSAQVSYELFKVLIPIIAGLKLLTELDWIRYLALPLEPLMGLLGLPADLGLVWATGMLVNLYSGLFVLMGLLPTLAPLTTEQTTCLALLMLIAHSFPAEGRIAQQCGASLPGQICIRMGVALLAVFLVHGLCTTFGWLNSPAVILFHAQPPAEQTLWEWGLGELRNLAGIFCIIVLVMLVQSVVQRLNIARLFELLLSPLLRLLGMGPSAATTVVFGLASGILYGSAIILKEARSGNLTEHEKKACMTFMGLSHGLIEDTCLMLLIGAQLIWILGFRLIITLGICMLFHALRGPDTFNRHPQTAPSRALVRWLPEGHPGNPDNTKPGR